MTQTSEETIQELRDENIELKLGSIRKELSAIKTDLHRHLDLIVEQTSKTNGSVGKALERIAAIEMENNRKRIEDLSDEVLDLKKELKFFRTLTNNKWIVALFATTMYALSIQEVRELIVSLLKL